MAFAEIVRRKITMPAHLIYIYDGYDQNLFLNFSTVATRIGDYTPPLDYLDKMDKWEIEKLTGFSREGKKRKDYVVDLPKE